MTDKQKALIEAIKEPTRYIGLGIVSYLITEGVSLLVDLVFGTKVDTTVKLFVIGILTNALRGIDKWLHEVGKATDNANLTLGLTRF
jgi:hypothetical protein